MARKILNNLETYGVIRNKINDNFTDLYDNKSDENHTHEQLHTHANKNQIDKIGEDVDGKFTYNGIPIEGGSGVSDYGDLSNKPTINNVELTGNKTLADLGIQPSEINGNIVVDGSEVNVYTLPSDVAKTSDLHYHNNKTTLDGVTPEKVAQWNTVVGKIDKVEGMGLSTNDYTTDEKNKLEGIDIGANKYIHPNDVNTRHVTDTEKAFWNGKSDFSGDYNDLLNLPSVLGDMTSDVYDPQGKAVDVFQYADNIGGSKLDKTGDTKDNITTFTEAEEDVDIVTGEKHSTIFGKILKSIKTLRHNIGVLANEKIDKSSIAQADTINDPKRVPSTAVTYALGQEVDTLNNNFTDQANKKYHIKLKNIGGRPYITYEEV